MTNLEVADRNLTKRDFKSIYSHSFSVELEIGFASCDPSTSCQYPAILPVIGMLKIHSDDDMFYLGMSQRSSIHFKMLENLKLPSLNHSTLPR